MSKESLNRARGAIEDWDALQRLKHLEREKQEIARIARAGALEQIAQYAPWTNTDTSQELHPVTESKLISGEATKSLEDQPW